MVVSPARALLVAPAPLVLDLLRLPDRRPEALHVLQAVPAQDLERAHALRAQHPQADVLHGKGLPYPGADAALEPEPEHQANLVRAAVASEVLPEDHSQRP